MRYGAAGIPGAAIARLSELEAAITQARHAKDTTAEAELCEEAAALAVAVGDSNRAIELMSSAMVARGVDPERPLPQRLPAVTVKTAYGLALVEARIANFRRRADRRFADVADACRASGDWSLQARAEEHRAELALSQGQNPSDLEAARDALLRAAHAWAETAASSTPERVRVLRRLALLDQLTGRPDAAISSVRSALELAEGTSTQLELRLDLHLLSRLLGIEPTDHDVDAVVVAAEDASQLGIAAYARLIRASEQGSGLPAAQDDAETARRAALALRDPLLYLMACMLAAELAEQEGDRVATLDVLFTAQASLAALLGEEARGPVLLVLHGLERRWGRTAFKQAHADYLARRG